jgi:N,N'-diacetyllegionaminate synthase
VELVTASAPKAKYQVENTGSGESQLQMLQKLELTQEHFKQLAEHCKSREIMFLSAPFDEPSADLLQSLAVSAFKIPSGELTNQPLLQHIARMGKPIILSTGMATLDEVGIAVETLQQAGNTELVLLHCTSNYPTPPEEVNLRAMDTLTRTFGVPVGYSDHTEGITIPIAAVARGACVVEKHFTLDRDLPGPDHIASLEPAELAAMVSAIRAVEAAMGDGAKQPTAAEVETAAAARKSLVAARAIPGGAVLEAADIAVRRPGTGITPSLRDSLVGRTIRSAVEEGTLFSLDMFE